MPLRDRTVSAVVREGLLSSIIRAVSSEESSSVDVRILLTSDG